MARIVSNFFISLDGVVEAPNEWHFDYFNDEMGAAIGAGVAEASAFLLGRRLYDEWSDYWPKEDPAQNEFAGFINNIPKYVVSDSLTQADWNNTSVVGGDVETQLREIKAKHDGAIQMSGSATTVRWLLAHGLVDELNLLLHPVVVGKGQRLFEASEKLPMELTSSTTFTTGVLHLVYAPVATSA
jgi:dihydrofolate reductase